MAIYFSQLDSHLSQHRRADLAQGFITYPKDRAAEVLWALMPDGTMLQSNELRIGQPHFFVKGRAWHAVNAIPEYAEFCGQYKPL